MPDSPFTLRVQNLGELALLIFEKDGQIVFQKSFDAPELDDFIHVLGRVRSGLDQEVTPELDPNARVEGVAYPPIVCREQPEGFEMIWRHPGYGWLSFVLGPEARKALGEALLRPEA